MKGLLSGVAGVALLLTLGVGTTLADPVDPNSRYIPGADCDGQVTNLVTMYGAASQDLGSTRVFVLMGAMRDGVWTLPLVPGQASKDLATCRYSNFGHDDVIFGRWSGGN